MNSGELVMDIGTVLDGEMAVSEGLIDSLGGLSEAIEKLYALIESQPDKESLEKLPPDPAKGPRKARGKGTAGRSKKTAEKAAKTPRTPAKGAPRKKPSAPAAPAPEAAVGRRAGRPRKGEE